MKEAILWGLCLGLLWALGMMAYLEEVEHLTNVMWKRHRVNALCLGVYFITEETFQLFDIDHLTKRQYAELRAEIERASQPARSTV